MKLKAILGLILIVCGLIPSMVQAQLPAIATVRLNQNQLVYSGAGENSGYMEYLPAGQEFIAGGRNADVSWIQVNIEGSMEGWVPAASLTLVAGKLEDLPLKGGLFDLGGGQYDINNEAIRNAEIQLILVQRPLRAIYGRWNLLQAFQGASCLNLPTPPAPPSALNAAVPETERIQREMTFVQEQTELSILIYQQLCDKGGVIDQDLFFRGLTHLNRAWDTWWVVRRYIDEITGLEYVAP